MRESEAPGISSTATLLTVLQAAVAAFVACTLGLYLKGNTWAREAALVGPLSTEAQRHEAVLRSVLFEAYQWNQTHRHPELSDLLRRLNVTVQMNPPGTGAAPNPAAPGTSKPATR